MDRRSVGLVALVALIWGLCFVLIRASLPSPAPLLLAGMRAFIGGGVLAIWFALGRSRQETGRSVDRSAPRPSWRAGLPSAPLLVVLGLMNAAVAFGAMYLAAGRTEAAIASILAGGQPLLLAAAGWALFSEKISARSAAGLTIALVGVVLVAASSSGVATPDGVGLALLASVAPSIGTILMRRLGRNIDLLLTTSAQFLLGGAMLLVASAGLEPWGDLTWSPAAVFGLIVLGVLGTGLAYGAWFWLLERSPLTKLGPALFLVPVVGVVAGFATGDRPPLADLAGIVLMLVGIGLGTVGGGRGGS